MSKFQLNFISNTEKRISTLANPSMLYDIVPEPMIILDFAGTKILNRFSLRVVVEIDYRIIGNFKIPKSFNLTQEQIDAQPGMIINQINTISEFEIISQSEYFDSNFNHNKEIENEIYNIAILAVKYNSSLVREKLRDTELSSYEVEEVSEEFIRETIMMLFTNSDA